MKTKILIVDDHDFFRESLKRFISDTLDMCVFTEAGSGDEALDIARSSDFDLVVLDIAMPGRSGLDVLKELKSTKPHLPVLILSMFPAEHYELSAMKTGAEGYVTKDKMIDELIGAMQRILHGKKYFSFSLPEELRGD